MQNNLTYFSYFKTYSLAKHYCETKYSDDEINIKNHYLKFLNFFLNQQLQKKYEIKQELITNFIDLLKTDQNQKLIIDKLDNVEQSFLMNLKLLNTKPNLFFKTYDITNSNWVFDANYDYFKYDDFHDLTIKYLEKKLNKIKNKIKKVNLKITQLQASIEIKDLIDFEKILHKFEHEAINLMF